MILKDKIKWHYQEFIKHHFPFLWSKHLSQVVLNRATDFSNPKDLNEKIQWLMFYTDTSLWTTLADKYAVRNYVCARIGEKYLVPLLGKWNRAEDIDFDALPDKFVIKPNNGSYDTIVCKDKRLANLDEIRQRMGYSLSHKFGYENAEPHYLSIKPCIIAEQLLETNNPAGLIDYKIWCFNGKPYCFLVCANRNVEKHHVDLCYYDLDWIKYEDKISDNFKNKYDCPQPSNLQEMLNVASKLSEGLPQVRVDLYNINGKVYFGEMTMSSNFGMMPYYPREVLLEMGNKVVLPQRTFREKVKTFYKRWFPLV